MVSVAGGKTWRQDALHEFERGAEAPGELERAVEDVAEEKVVRAVLAQEAACAGAVRSVSQHPPIGTPRSGGDEREEKKRNTTSTHLVPVCSMSPRCVCESSPCPWPRRSRGLRGP